MWVTVTLAVVLGVVVIFSQLMTSNSKNQPQQQELVWRQGYLDLHHIRVGCSQKYVWYLSGWYHHVD
jgi:hypothetical protein